MAEAIKEKTEKAKSDTEKVYITEDDFFRIAMGLEQKNSLFYKVWELGTPRTTKEIPTAAVRFDKKGIKIDFMFNPELWKNSDDYNRAFIISHEALHVALNHGSRMKGALEKGEEMELINIAADIVVNHTLVNKFGFSRKKIKNANNFCWVDTVFGEKGMVGATKEFLKKNGAKLPKTLDKKQETPKDDKAFEYYYRLLKDKAQELRQAAKDGNVKLPQGQGGGGQGMMGQPQTVDDHGPMTESGSSEEICKELSERMGDKEKNDIKDVIDQHYEHEKKEGDEDGDTKTKGGQQAGTSGGGCWKFVDPKLLNVVKKKKWETIIKKWAQKYLRNDFKDVEQWARKHRRTSLVNSGSMFLPCEMEVEDMFEEEEKITVMFFMDTSGSCSAYGERFFKAAHSLPEEKFTLRAFCFDTDVREIDLKKNQMFDGGGTYFHIIEQKIQEIMAKEKSKYPQAVFVLTDGYGDSVHPQVPEKWFWFLSEGKNSYNQSYIPSKSQVYSLKDFE